MVSMVSAIGSDPPVVPSDVVVDVAPEDSVKSEISGGGMGSVANEASRFESRDWPQVGRGMRFSKSDDVIQREWGRGKNLHRKAVKAFGGFLVEA